MCHPFSITPTHARSLILVWITSERLISYPLTAIRPAEQHHYTMILEKEHQPTAVMQSPGIDRVAAMSYYYRAGKNPKRR